MPFILTHSNLSKSTILNLCDLLNSFDKFRFPILELPITFYFIHSFGPIINVIRSVLGKNTIKNKYKTER